MIRADQLDNEQSYFIFEESKRDGNKWLRGFPGTGKSVLLIHLLLEKIEENPNVHIAVVVFTNSLREMFEAAMIESGVPYHNVYLTTYHQFSQQSFNYDYIFCDEVQDLPQDVLEDMNKRCKQLIVAGDENQSIYTKDPKTYTKVVDILNLGHIIDSTPYQLETIYRSTPSVINAISCFLPNMKIELAEFDKTKQDVTIRLVEKESEEEEVKYILSKSNEAINNNQSSVILLPSHQEIEDFITMVYKLNSINEYNIPTNKWGKTDYEQVNQQLKRQNINLEYLGNKYGNLYNANQNGKTILMTYHSAKGLDFDNVFLAFQSRGFSNLYFPNDYDDKAKKTLFMVGMTRSKKNLYLTHTGYLPDYVETFEHLCTKVEDTRESDDEFDFDFDF